jgi:sterol desaturase/sphingolipid hydroxylase (fatty acid hydroxylase superfamily)
MVSIINYSNICFTIKCISKLLIGFYIISSINAKVSFFTPWIVCLISYFIFGGILLIYLEKYNYYYFIKMTWNKDDLFQHIDTSMFDLCLILPISIWFVYRYQLFSLIIIKYNEIQYFYHSIIKIIMIPISILIGLIWRMLIHRLFHHPLLYKSIHKKHHDRPDKMTPFCAFYDHPIEFILMEVIGTFLLPLYFNPLPTEILCILWAWQCISGILDHSNAIIQGSYLVDATYHFIHHQVCI